jgi:microcystin-dependent protein
MSEPYLGEIRMFAGNFAPSGWNFCDGSVVPISFNDALYSLLGTTYGGDGVTTFALPDLRGRVPIHQGNSSVIGRSFGEETHTLQVNEIPSHNHSATASTSADSVSPSGAVYASGINMYVPTPTVQMNPSAIGANAGGQPHENRMPCLAISFIISMEGIFPSQG